MDRNRSIQIGTALALIFFILCLGGFIAMRIHSERVRQKAEQLQAEVLKLTPGVTTLEEVRAFVSRTERPAGYAGFSGPKCDESECVVSIGPMAFLKGWEYPSFRRLAFLGIRPADYTAVVKVKGGVVREVSAGMFYGTGPRRITSASVILMEQFSDIDLPSTAAMDEEHGIAVCSGFDRNKSGGGVRYAVIEIATKQHPKGISLDLSCVTSSGECTDIREFFHPEDSPEYRAIIDRSDATCSSKAQPYYP